MLSCQLITNSMDDNCLSLLLSHLETVMLMEQVKFLQRWA